jgi:hypothetical protein
VNFFLDNTGPHTSVNLLHPANARYTDDLLLGRERKAQSIVNAGEKMHRRAGVKMHHGHSQVS